MTDVMNLNTEQVSTYSLSPREAVIAAYAQARGDWNTWDYAKHYSELVYETTLCFTIGDFSSFKDGRRQFNHVHPL